MLNQESSSERASVSDLLADASRLRKLGQLGRAQKICRQILSHQTAHPAATHLLGILRYQSGDLREAISLLDRATELAPDSSEFHNSLASVLGASGRHQEAAAQAARAIGMGLVSPDLYDTLGLAMEHQGHLEEAVRCFRQAIELKSDHVRAHIHLGNVLRRCGRLDSAAAAYRNAIAIRSRVAESLIGLAAAYGAMGRATDTASCWRQLRDLRPSSADTHSNLIHVLHYPSEVAADEIYAESRLWERRHAERFYADWPRHRADGHIDVPLRIGYVSPDLWNHPVGRLLLPVLVHHDRSKFRTFCYADVKRPDPVTARLREAADVWRETAPLSDDKLADQIRTDQIDILVDLAGHMAGNRLLVFARKPSPVQVTWLGYPDTTGLRAIDYRVSDVIADPPAVTDQYHSESLWRLTRPPLCYIGNDSGPAVQAPPALTAGQVTFGCFNKGVKISKSCATLWAEILQSIPASRLAVTATRGDPEGAVRRTLIEAGIPSHQLLVLESCATHDDYLRLFSQIDIALDPFPYNGTTTTCDGLWMGVPHVVMIGNTCASRMGASLVLSLDLPELAADTPAGYVEKARRLAHDLDSVAHFRRVLRGKMMERLGDAPRFTRELEIMFYKMWCQYLPAK